MKIRLWFKVIVVDDGHAFAKSPMLSRKVIPVCYTNHVIYIYKTSLYSTIVPMFQSKLVKARACSQTTPFAPSFVAHYNLDIP